MSTEGKSRASANHPVAAEDQLDSEATYDVEPSSVVVGALGLLGAVNPIVLTIDEIDDALHHLDQVLKQALQVNNADIRALQLVDRRQRRGLTTRLRDLGPHLGVTSGTSTAIAKRLEQAGLLRSAAEPTDRRGRILIVTPRAEEIIQDLLQPTRTELAELLGSLSGDEEARILEILERARDILQRPAS